MTVIPRYFAEETFSKTSVAAHLIMQGVIINNLLCHVMRKCVFGDFRPGKIQTSLLSDRN